METKPSDNIRTSANKSVSFDSVPSERVLVVRWDSESQQRESLWLRWGLIPPRVEDPAIGNRLVHARAETVMKKPVFREAYRHRRCLIAVDSFKLPGTKRQWAIQMKDGRPFGVGGIWERWQREDEPIESCAIITTEANDLVRPTSQRMPVIIAAEDYDRWLDPEFFDAEELQRMMQAYPAEEMMLVPGR